MSENSEVPISTQPAPIASAFQLLDEEYLSDTGLIQLLASVGVVKTPRTIAWWREVKKGPPPTRIGKSILYRKSSILRWLASQEEGPTEPRRRGRPRQAGAR